MFKVSIPEITDEELARRYKQIKPIIKVNGRWHYLKEYSIKELKISSYIWNIENDIREIVEPETLEALPGKDFSCLHKLGDCGFFYPTVGEVLAQIKRGDVKLVKAFEIIKAPKDKINVERDRLEVIALKNGYHVSTVRLYK